MKDEVPTFLNWLLEVRALVTTSIVFAILSTIVRKEQRTLIAYLTAIIMAVPIGFITFYIAEDYQLKEGVTIALVATSSVLGYDLIKFILSFGNWLNTNSSSIFEFLFYRFKDRKKK